MKFLCSAFVIIIGTAARSLFAQSDIPLVDIKDIDPRIVIDLRYAGANNIAGRPLYPRETRALVRPELAKRLVAAQKFLHRYNYGLKIWDAYRPRSVQVQLWEAAHNNNYVADPDAGAGSLHAWGVAVDATLTDNWHRFVTMPTDFDDFTPAAMWKYQGADPDIRRHLHLLQVAMRDAGFYGLRSEWWHFTLDDWKRFLPDADVKRAEQAFGTRWQGKL